MLAGKGWDRTDAAEATGAYGKGTDCHGYGEAQYWHVKFGQRQGIREGNGKNNVHNVDETIECEWWAQAQCAHPEENLCHLLTLRRSSNTGSTDARLLCLSVVIAPYMT